MRSNTEIAVDRSDDNYVRPVFIVLETPGLRRAGSYSQHLNACVDAYTNTVNAAIYNPIGPGIHPYRVNRRASAWDFSVGNVGEDYHLGRFTTLRTPRQGNKPLNGREVRVTNIVYHWPYAAPLGKADYIYRDDVPQSEYSHRLAFDLHVSAPQFRNGQWFVQIACIRTNPSEPRIFGLGADQRMRINVEWYNPMYGSDDPETIGGCYPNGDFDVIALPAPDEHKRFLRVLPTKPTEYLQTCNENAQSMGRTCQELYINRVDYHYSAESGQPQVNTAGR